MCINVDACVLARAMRWPACDVIAAVVVATAATGGDGAIFHCCCLATTTLNAERRFFTWKNSANRKHDMTSVNLQHQLGHNNESSAIHAVMAAPFQELQGRAYTSQVVFKFCFSNSQDLSKQSKLLIENCTARTMYKGASFSTTPPLITPPHPPTLSFVASPAAMERSTRALHERW